MRYLEWILAGIILTSAFIELGLLEPPKLKSVPRKELNCK